MKCSLCRKSCRARSRVYVAMGDGALTPMLLGPCCSRAAIMITAAAVETQDRCSCGQVPVKCAKCVDKLVSRPVAWEKKLAARLRKLADAYKTCDTSLGHGAGSDAYEAGRAQGRAVGLEQAADLVEASNRPGSNT